MLLNSLQVWSFTSVRVAQTKLNCEQKVSKKQLVFLLNSGFSAEKKFYREHLLTFWKLDFTAVENKFYMRTTRVLEPEDSKKEILDVQTTIVLERSYSKLVQIKLVLTYWCFFGILSVSRCILSTFFKLEG